MKEYKNSLDDQIEFILHRNLIPKNKSNIIYYIEINGMVYKNIRSSNMYFSSKKKAIKTLVTMISNRAWELFSLQKNQAIDLIYCEILYLIQKGTIKIKPIIIN